jgi:predicted amidohydrolase YtcJ
MRIVPALSIIIMMTSSCMTTKQPADLIIHSATIQTMDDSLSVRECLVVKDGKILATGTTRDMLNTYEATQLVDGKGMFIYPGFYDAHCHFYGFGLNLINSADLKGTKSLAEIVEVLRKHQHEHQPTWILGRGWDQNAWADTSFPEKTMLDKEFPDIPVFITRVDGHAALANAEALKRAGITVESKIEGGNIEVKDGKLTGLLIDNAMEPVNSVIPKPDRATLMKALVEAEKICFASGLTSVADAGLEHEVIAIMDSLQKNGLLKIRIYAMLEPSAQNLESYVRKGIYKTDRLNVRSIKLYADGALGSRGARLFEPYTDDPANSGMIMNTYEWYAGLCRQALEGGYQVCTHAIGDSAVRFVLSLYSGFLKGENDLRWRIEHAQVVNDRDLRLFGEYAVIPSVQPTHATSDMYWAEERLGDRLRYAYRNKDLLKQNGWLPLGTDFPVEQVNPLLTLYAAVTRKDLAGWPEGGFNFENSLTLLEAVRGITLWPAKAAFEENEKGSLVPGKFADFVILDNDLLSVDPLRLTSVKVLQTYVGGEKVYSGE